MKPRLIALCGYARTGKDEAAHHLIEQGYVRRAFGDDIKAFYAPFLNRSVADPDTFIRAMHARRDPRVSHNEVEQFAQDVLLPYWRSGQVIDAFTEDDRYKTPIRPILEAGGDLVYSHIKGVFFSRIDAAPTQAVVNARLCRVEEAEAWLERGGVIVEVQRAGWGPATEWDGDTMRALRAAGVITHTVQNDCATGEEWRRRAPALLRDLTLPLKESA